MNAEQHQAARARVAGAVSGELSFPQIVGLLHAVGFEGYWVDLRAGTATYYLPSGEAVSLRAEAPYAAATPAFDSEAVVHAIREAQQGGPGYTYIGFCAKVARAGCVG